MAGGLVTVLLRLTNGIRCAAYSAARGYVRLGHFVPTPHSTHILQTLVLLRKPLFGFAKRRIPRTLCVIVGNDDGDFIKEKSEMIENILNYKRHLKKIEMYKKYNRKRNYSKNV